MLSRLQALTACSLACKVSLMLAHDDNDVWYIKTDSSNPYLSVRLLREGLRHAQAACSTKGFRAATGTLLHRQSTAQQDTPLE